MLPPQIQQLKELALEAEPEVTIEIDGPPTDPDGIWLIDLLEGEYKMVVEWSTVGIGVTRFKTETPGYGAKPDEYFSSWKLAAERICELLDSTQTTNRKRRYA